MKPKLTFLLALTFLFLFSGSVWAENNRINLTCVWTVHGKMIESFIIYLKKKTVFWIEEEKSFQISKLHDGFIKFEGMKSYMVGNRGMGLKNVKVLMKINRITGQFHVFSEQVKTDRIGNCIIGKVF
jgi:hypothetical protein